MLVSSGSPVSGSSSDGRGVHLRGGRRFTLSAFFGTCGRVGRWRIDCGLRRRRRPPPRNLLQTLEYVFDARPIAWSGLPATLQHIPNVIHEPRPFLSLRSSRAFTFANPHNNGVVSVLVKRCSTAQDFVYHHPECVTVRAFRPAAVLETELLRIEELWTHPSVRPTLSE